VKTNTKVRYRIVCSPLSDHAFRGVFTEGNRIYTNSGFRRKTHIQICVRDQANIHGVFRVRERYFSRTAATVVDDA
jgi:hypothetical protein